MKTIAKLFACKLMLVVGIVSVTGCGASAVSAPASPASVAPVSEFEPPGYELKVVENGHGMPFGYGTPATIGMSSIRRATPVLEPVKSGPAPVAAK